jgi:hypothetical protein
MIQIGRLHASGRTADRLSRKLDTVMRLAKSLSDPNTEVETMAQACDAAARDLVSAASLLRRLNKQQNKSGAAGAVHET